MTSIAQNAFTANKNLTEVIIPEGILRVNSEAFDECSNITKVVFPTTLEYIGGTAFASMINLEDISTLKDTRVTIIEADAFSDDSNLREVILPETLIQLGGYIFYDDRGIEQRRGVVFRNCRNLSHVVIRSKSLIYVGSGNFGGCPLLTSAGPIGGNYSIEYA